MASLVTYSFGIVRSDDPLRRGQLGDLCNLASKVVGASFIPYVAPSYRELRAAVAAGRVAFGWMPPMLILELEDQRLASPIALPIRFGSTASFYAALITPRGGAKTLAELKGARAAWVEPESVAGYVMPRLHLALSGFDLKSFARESFERSHDGVVQAVTSGRADVGATFCTIDPRTNHVVHGGWTSPDGSAARPVEILATAGPLANDAIGVAATVPADVREKMLAWLLHLDSQAAIDVFAKIMRAESFVRATPAHYAPLRLRIAQARSRGLLDAVLRGPGGPAGT